MDQRKIVGLMFLAAIFALIGEEIKSAKQPKQSAGAVSSTELSGGARVLLGSVVATVILSGIAQAGEVGSQIGTGLAGLACVTSVLVEGGPVWTALNNVLTTGNTTKSAATSNLTVTQTTAVASTPGP
jgi:hypothetical protein